MKNKYGQTRILYTTSPSGGAATHLQNTALETPFFIESFV